MLNNEQKKKLLALARSSKLRQDLRQVSKNRHNPFTVNGDINMDCLLTFLNEYNYFINHTPGPFRKIIDRNGFCSNKESETRKRGELSIVSPNFKDTR